jgi:hypothetical protein
MDALVLNCREIRVTAGDEVYLLTDAMSRYVFKHIDQLAAIAAIQDFDDLLRFAEEQWQGGSLENDDLTMVRLSVDNDNGLTVAKIQPPTGFSFSMPASPLVLPPDPPNRGSMNGTYGPVINDLRLQLNALQEKVEFLAARPAPASVLTPAPVQPWNKKYLNVFIVLLLVAFGSIVLLAYSNFQLRAAIQRTSVRTDSALSMASEARKIKERPPRQVVAVTQQTQPAKPPTLAPASPPPINRNTEHGTVSRSGSDKPQKNSSVLAAERKKNTDSDTTRLNAGPKANPSTAPPAVTPDTPVPSSDTAKNHTNQ